MLTQPIVSPDMHNSIMKNSSFSPQDIAKAQERYVSWERMKL